jgi:hypothetical protein
MSLPLVDELSILLSHLLLPYLHKHVAEIRDFVGSAKWCNPSTFPSNRQFTNFSSVPTNASSPLRLQFVFFSILLLHIIIIYISTSMSKIFERLLLKRIEEAVPLNILIANHEIGFRTKHSTIQQCHRIINKIKTSFEGKQNCASEFLDV